MKRWNKPTMSYEDMWEKSKTFTGKDKDMDERVKSMADQTWGIIGGDVLDSLKFSDSKHKETMKRSEVIEVVCDADYMFTHGDDPEAYAYYMYLRDNHPKHRNKIMKEAFPYKTYGF